MTLRMTGSAWTQQGYLSPCHPILLCPTRVSPVPLSPRGLRRAVPSRPEEQFTLVENRRECVHQTVPTLQDGSRKTTKTQKKWGRKTWETRAGKTCSAWKNHVFFPLSPPNNLITFRKSRRTFKHFHRQKLSVFYQLTLKTATAETWPHSRRWSSAKKNAESASAVVWPLELWVM